jgi:hypothetical protein
MTAVLPVQERLGEFWGQLVTYAVNFDFQVGVQPLSTWQAPAVSRTRLKLPTSELARPSLCSRTCSPTRRRAVSPEAYALCRRLLLRKAGPSWLPGLRDLDAPGLNCSPSGDGGAVFCNAACAALLCVVARKAL